MSIVKDTFDRVPWIPVKDAPSFSHGGLPVAPLGFTRETRSENGTVTHSRFVSDTPTTRFQVAGS